MIFSKRKSWRDHILTSLWTLIFLWLAITFLKEDWWCKITIILFVSHFTFSQLKQISNFSLDHNLLVVARKYWMRRSSYKKNRCSISLSTMLAIALLGCDCSPDKKRLNLLRSTLHEDFSNSVVNGILLKNDQWNVCKAYFMYVNFYLCS